MVIVSLMTSAPFQLVLCMCFCICSIKKTPKTKLTLKKNLRDYFGVFLLFDGTKRFKFCESISPPYSYKHDGRDLLYGLYLLYITQPMQRRWCAKGAEEIIIPSLKYVRVANRTHSQSIKRFGRSRSTKQIILQSCSVSHVCNLPFLSDQQVLPYIPHIGFFNS